MIPQGDVTRVTESLSNRVYWRHYDASTFLRNELYMDFLKSKDKHDYLKRYGL